MLEMRYFAAMLKYLRSRTGSDEMRSEASGDPEGLSSVLGTAHQEAEAPSSITLT
jgi:hypothetical protein